jgi:hypothetical protein
MGSMKYWYHYVLCQLWGVIADFGSYDGIIRANIHLRAMDMELFGMPFEEWIRRGRPKKEE